jgi:hypothetical protein
MDSKNFNRRDFARVAGLVGLASVGGSVVSQGLYSDPDRADRVHHYVFFNRDRGRIHDAAFLQTKAFEGAQLKYIWRELEPQKDKYDFREIEQDLVFLHSTGKRMFIQIQDASFDPAILPFPGYLMKDPAYRGGADQQYDITDEDEEHAVPAGWVARRWDKVVRERFHRLLLALGREFDGRIEGINLPETAVDFGTTGRLFPKGFTPEIYCEAIVINLAVLKRAFRKSKTIQYANFMPGGKSNLERVYQRAKELKIGLGGPDLLPYKPGQMENSYPLIRRYAGSVPTGIAVQDGNYEYKDPKTGQQVTIAQLLDFATHYLRVDYVFWCTQEPYYSEQLIPFLQHAAPWARTRSQRGSSSKRFPLW